MRAGTPVLLGVLALAALHPPPAAACSVCYCGDPTLLPVGLVQPEPGQLRLSLDGSFLHKETGEEPAARLFTPRHLGEDGFEAHDELRLTMTGALTLGDATLTALVPWVSKTLTSREGAAVESGEASGPGDIELYARRQLFLSRRLAPVRHILSISAGVKLPTGEARALGVDGAPLDSHLQPGSGSFDFLAGPAYTYDADPFSLYASVLGRYNGAGPDGLRYGASLLVNAAARYRLSDYALAAVQLSGRLTARDAGGGGVDPNSGGAILFAAPQLVVRPAGRWALRAAVQLPVANALYGVQRESPVAQLGVSYDL
jgi:hypothetical protein